MEKKELKKLYHATRKENVESIISSSLYPGKIIGKHNTYHGKFCGDPNYIYFFNEETIRELCRLMYTMPDKKWGFNFKKHTLLEVTLPDKHPIERDYDQLLYILSHPKKNKFRNTYVKPYLKRFGIEFKGRLSKNNIIKHIDLITDYIWDCCAGSYRTLEPIPGRNIKDIGFEHLLKYNQK